MYCPKCGLQQVSEDLRFCSRCGLPISGLAEWLASGAMLARSDKAPGSLASPRRKGISRGAKLMFLSVVLTPIFMGLSFLFDEATPLLVPFTVFLAGLSLMLYSRLFFEEVPLAKSQAPPHRLGTAPDSNALPPASNIGMSSISGKQVRTSELAPPPSVTEHTTKLLNNE